MPGVTTLTLTGNALIDGALDGAKWSVTALSFSFPTLASQYPATYGFGVEEPDFGFASLTASAQTAARAGFAQYQAVSGLTFTENLASPGNADIRLAISSRANPSSYTYFPMDVPGGEGGDVWLGTSPDFNTTVTGNFGYMKIIHEIGHALGLKHGHEIGSFGFPAMPRFYDRMEYSIMSFRPFLNANSNGGYTNEEWGYAQSLMMADIAGVQEMYGANFNTNSGDTVYSFSSTTGQMFINGAGQDVPGDNRVFRTVWDGGGVDTYDFSNYTDNQRIDLTPGGNSLFSVSQRVMLDQFFSTSIIFAEGNLYNALQYHGDTRSLIENAAGGSGNDAITGNDAGNNLMGNAGNDTLNGGNGNDRLFGGTGNDILNGDGDDDILNGMIGNDVMSGGAGNDRFYVFDVDDQVFETQTGGTADRVYAALNYTLAASQHVEFLHAYGAATTGPGVMLGGNELANTIYGGAGNDTLNGGGGNDKLYGHAGNDTLDGGDGADFLQGEVGNDRLTGGLGMDNLFGGAGNDVFVLQPLSANRDTIRDYVAADDQLEISASLFGPGLVANQALSAAQFLANTTGTATLANGGSIDTRFIYNTSNGVLYFDADGAGSGARVQIATLQNAGAAAAGLTAADFTIV